MVGMLCVVTEDTERVIAQQRMAVLRELGSESRSRSRCAARQSSSTWSARQLAGHPGLLPFTLVYLYDDDATVPTALLMPCPLPDW